MELALTITGWICILAGGITLNYSGRNLWLTVAGYIALWAGVGTYAAGKHLTSINEEVRLKNRVLILDHKEWECNQSNCDTTYFYKPVSI